MKIFEFSPQQSIKNVVFALALILLSPSVFAAIKVFSCEPEWQSLLQELAAEKVEIFTATSGLQDPHQIQARPSLISQMRDAQLLVCTGADLEVGWLPLLLRRASNNQLNPGNSGYFMAADHVRLLGIPASIDRSQGDIHAAGNPHVHTSPKNIRLIAIALSQRLQQIDPQNSAFYQQRGEHFLKRWQSAMKRWSSQLQSIRGIKFVGQHDSWDYFSDFAKIEQIATIEEKPGIPATSGHLAKLLEQLKQQPAKAIIYAAYQNGKSAQWLSGRSGIPVVKLPFTVGGSEQVTDLFSLFDQSFNLLIAAIDSNKETP